MQDTTQALPRPEAEEDRAPTRVTLHPGREESAAGPFDPSRHLPPPGERYAVVAPLAQGGMGEISLVWDPGIGRTVAMKVLRLDASMNMEDLQRFLQEAKTTGQLQHPNIVPILDLGQTLDGRAYFTMPFIEGEDLATAIDRLRRDEPAAVEGMTVARRLQICLKICEAIEFSHARRVIHRDLKPANVMIGPFGEVLVLDWGIARIRDSGPPPSLEELRAGGRIDRAVRLPDDLRIEDPANSILGTPQYMAPEQIQPDLSTIDERTDVYGIGAIMYHLFTLHPPHDGVNPTETLRSVLTRRPRKPESFSFHQGRIPREISVIIMRALEARKEDRYASAREMREDIERYLEGKAKVICVHTGFKRALRSAGSLVDDYHHVAIIGFTIILTFPWMVLLLLLISP